MKKISCKYYFLSILFSLVLLTGCNDDVKVELPAISGIESAYSLMTNEELVLNPEVAHADNATYEWYVDGKKVATTPSYTFKAPQKEGTYSILLKVDNGGGIAQRVIKIEVEEFTYLAVNTYTLLALEIPQDLSNKKSFEWTVSKAPGDFYQLAYPKTKKPLFIAGQTGDYEIEVKAEELTYKYFVKARQGVVAQTPYIAKVFDYNPAPGQFVNELPKYTEGDTYKDMVEKVESSLVGKETMMITLGGWGGSVTFGFDHTVINVSGKCDFRIKGNAFGANSNPRPNPPFGGSCEPGIIMVAYDKNKNGKPDEEEWYEIEGSGNFSAEKESWYSFVNKEDRATLRNYEMTYHKPTTEALDDTGADTGADNFVSIEKYVKWIDNQGNEGYKIKNKFHNQSYYPRWIKEEQLTFKGIRLADNGIDEGGQGNYYVLYAYKYGYVDNYPNVDERSAIDIEWAIDKKGNKVNLPGIDFVKIYNGVDKENGWLGEASTEVDGGEDLHMQGISIDSKI